MAEYIDKKRFLASMGLTGDETKYGNRDAEHQHRSYSTYMSYEIMDCVDDSIVEEELVPVVRCGECAHRIYKYIDEEVGAIGGCELYCCATPNDHYCSFGTKVKVVLDNG